MTRFFINRPIFAIVIALITIFVGLLSIVLLPIAEYPDIVPPQVQVSTQYLGASAETVAKEVTTPLERSINGAEGMIFISSSSTNNGDSVITVTFDVGYPLDIAAVNVLSKTNPAMPMLPETVLKSGVTVSKVSSNLLLAVNLLSPNGTFDSEYLGNYAEINLADALARIPGVGKVENFGLRKYAMRIWLDPNKMASTGITTSDVINAIEDQNIQSAAGKIGAAPAPKDQVFEYQINTKGRLQQVKDFKNIVIRAEPDGRIVRLDDIGDVELGAQDYSSNANFDGKATAAVGIYQLPGANALNIAKHVRQLMEKASQRFPEDMTYLMAYDTSKFIRASMQEVVKTLFQAIALVVLVVFVFLQNWRAIMIPAIAIPVALIGTMFIFLLFGFSINTLSLLGLVLAIGLVVDDAIVVVENVMRLVEEGEHDLKAATIKAMDDVKGPIVATTLVLMAVFVPVAFLPGITGRLYNQFSLAVAFAVGLSGINSLSLSPALCACFLSPKKQQKALPFRVFNSGFKKLSGRYEAVVSFLMAHWRAVILSFILISASVVVLFWELPSAFVPSEDQGYFITVVQAPSGSSLNRLTAITKGVEKILLKLPGVGNVMVINGFNLIDGVDQPNVGVLFSILKPWKQRTTANTKVDAIIKQARTQLAGNKNATIMSLNPSPIPGIGTSGNLTFELQDLAHRGPIAMAAAVNTFVNAANARPELLNVFTTYSADVPQLYLDLDRNKAKSLGVSIADTMQALQVYLGSYYINEFNKFGQTYRVIVQAKKMARDNEDDIKNIYVSNNQKKMVPLSALVTLKDMTGPYDVTRYNLYDSALINAEAAPGYSSGQAIKAMEQVAATALSNDYGYEWTGLTYQQIKVGNLAPLVFVISLIFVFLFLAALYESWSLPIMIILAVPLALLGATLALLIRGIDFDIYAQIGVLMLIGLAAKNAILIVEFAKQRREAGASIVDAAKTAAKLRLRPILMTAFAFIFGVLPLLVATGAGAASRHSIGTTVVGGMLTSTFLSLVIVPVFYVVIETLREKWFLNK